ncbi:MAG TPA: hypothetical protein VHL11_20440 [Phototrophicaceae bacterium]|jgi:hypothetical protein|nr:hypothetical protein [Phototrophicaceae bacterium]
MTYLKPLVLLSGIVLLLTACGGGSNPTITPPASTSINLVPLDSNPPVVDVSGVTAGAFKLSFSGVVTAEVSGMGQGQIASASSPEKSITLLLYAPGATDAPARGVTIVMPENITSGTYAIQSYYGVFDSKGLVTNIGAVVSEPGGAGAETENIATLYDSTGGELKLVTVNPMTGSLKLDAKSPDANISVQGTFNEVQVVQSP